MAKATKIKCEVISISDRVTIVKAGDIVYIEPGIGTDLGDGTLIISEHEIRATDLSPNSLF